MKFLEKAKTWNKKTVAKVVGALFLGLFIGVGSSPLCSDTAHEGVEDKVAKLEATIKEKDNAISSKDKEIETLNTKVADASPWFKMGEEEQRKIDEENKRVEAEKKAEEQRLAEEKKKEEERLAEEQRLAEEKKAEEERLAEEQRLAEEKKKEEERVAKEEAEKNKYETGISYNDVARNPEDNMFVKGKVKGKVIQVIEGDTHNNLRVAVGGDYDKVAIIEYQTNLTDGRILEDDQITVYGTWMGTMTYTSSMNVPITIPAFLAEKIDM